MLHISELADHKVESPEEVVKVGDEIEVKVLRVDPADRKIGLSRKRLGLPDEEVEAAEEHGRGASGSRKPSASCAAAPASGAGQLFQMPETARRRSNPCSRQPSSGAQPVQPQSGDA